MSSKKPRDRRQRSIFDVCFPCFSRTVHCDDLVCNAYGRDFTDYEYVIENLAIKRIPKKLMEETQFCFGKGKPKAKKQQSGHEVKRAPPEIFIGPVGKVDDASPEDLRRSRECRFCVPCTPTFPTDAEPEGAQCPAASGSKRNDGATTSKMYYVEASSALEDDVFRQILHPYSAYGRERSGKVQVSADVHRTDREEDFGPKAVKPEKTMPTEIKKTIEALKMAKPHSSEYPPRNRRSLVRTVSTTSCDKEISCNLYDSNSDERNYISKDLETDLCKEEKILRQKKRPTVPTKFKSSSSTSDATQFPDIIECEETESCDLLSTENSRTDEKTQKGQSLKWKIIINKHKKDKK